MKNFNERLDNINSAHMKHSVMLSTLLTALDKKGVVTSADLTAAFQDIHKRPAKTDIIQPEGAGSPPDSGGDAKAVPAPTVENPAGGSGANGTGLAG